MKKKMRGRVCKLVSRLTHKNCRSLQCSGRQTCTGAHCTRRVRDFADEQHAVVLRSEKMEALAKGVKA